MQRRNLPSRRRPVNLHAQPEPGWKARAGLSLALLSLAAWMPFAAPAPVGAQQQQSAAVVPATVPFEIERSVILKRDPATSDGSYWMHARAAMIPSSAADRSGKNPIALMVLFKFLGRSDFYSGVYTMRSEDLGSTWTKPILEPQLDWVKDGEVNIAVADVVPDWHTVTQKYFAIGAQVRYSPQGKQLEDRPRAHQTAYTVYDPGTGEWKKWRTIEMPQGEQFNFARNACAQSVVEENGDLLLPFYIGERVGKPFSSTVVRCSFDGDEIKYIEHGNVLELETMRGLYEPSLVKFAGRYLMTMRNDVKGYVSVSDDGLQFAAPQAWTFDDGVELGSYNTQQHWMTLGEGDGAGLFLIYTRRGADNDHVVRHRAPLFMAQVDPERMMVMRATEKILVPEKGATLGNSGVTVVSADESWVTVGEANVDRPEAKKGGAEGSVYVVKVKRVAE